MLTKLDAVLHEVNQVLLGKEPQVRLALTCLLARGHLLVEGRNAAAVDCARTVGVAAAMVDATVPKASLTYETQQGRGLEHTEYGVEPYAEAIAARLSLDDVVPRGQRMRFDFGTDLGAVQPTGQPVED